MQVKYVSKIFTIVCSPGRIRTCDQSITRIHSLLYGVDYIITGHIAVLTVQGASYTYMHYSPFGIVSEPSVTFVTAWLLIALAYAVGVPAIHLVFKIDFSIRLLF
jgi:hypothetical protein